jgi:hypothetical protein
MPRSPASSKTSFIFWKNYVSQAPFKVPRFFLSGELFVCGMVVSKRIILSVLVGAILGAAISVITNNALIEISLNSGFAFVSRLLSKHIITPRLAEQEVWFLLLLQLFGFALLLVGGVIFWRVCIASDTRSRHNTALAGFSILVSLRLVPVYVDEIMRVPSANTFYTLQVCLSGLSCLVVDKNLVTSLSPNQKIPL